MQWLRGSGPDNKKIIEEIVNKIVSIERNNVDITINNKIIDAILQASVLIAIDHKDEINQMISKIAETEVNIGQSELQNLSSAFYHIFEFARTARAGNLGDKRGWLAEPGYFLISSIYRLLLPLVVFKLMQVQLTIFDIKLIPSINVQYKLARQLYFLFAADFGLSQNTPQLEYKPDSKVTPEELSKHPDIYSKQGIYLGIIDSLLKLLIEEDDKSNTDGIPRIIGFGEFQKKYFQNSQTSEGISSSPFEPFIHLFLNFHPRSRPVLWRILLTQAHIYQAIKNINEMREYATEFKVIRLMSEEDRRQFDWRMDANQATDEEVLVNPFQAISDYFLNSSTLCDFFLKNQ